MGSNWTNNPEAYTVLSTAVKLPWVVSLYYARIATHWNRWGSRTPFGYQTPFGYRIPFGYRTLFSYRAPFGCWAHAEPMQSEHSVAEYKWNPRQAEPHSVEPNHIRLLSTYVKSKVIRTTFGYRTYVESEVIRTPFSYRTYVETEPMLNPNLCWIRCKPNPIRLVTELLGVTNWMCL